MILFICLPVYSILVSLSVWPCVITLYMYHVYSFIDVIEKCPENKQFTAECGIKLCLISKLVLCLLY